PAHSSQGDSQLVLQNNPDDPLRSAAQRKGITGTCRLLVYREEGDQAVDLVSEGDGDADQCGWARVVRTGRLGVVGDRLGNTGVLAVMQRVVAAHDALQFGELTDHPGR